VVFLTTLGSVDLRSEGCGVDLLEHPKRFAVLAYVGAFPGRRYQRESVMAMFWPEADDSHARNALRQSLHVIRQSVPSGALVSHRGGMLSVNADLVRSDAGEFCRLMDEGLCEAALENYGGDFLPGFYVEEAPDFERWCDEQQSRLRRMALEALCSLADDAADQGALETALAHARRGVELFPHDESMARRLLRLLFRQQNVAAMTDEFERLRHRLARDLGISPSAETAEMVGRAQATLPSNGNSRPDRRRVVRGGGRRMEDRF